MQFFLMKLSAYKEAQLRADYDTIIKALKKTNFKRKDAADLLGIDRKTLYNKLKAYERFFELNEQN